MVSLILLVLAPLALAMGPQCVPDKKTLDWKSPCEGQTFPNRISISSVEVTQFGQDVDALGGMDMQIPLDILSAIDNKYGEVAKPLVDMAVYEYTMVANKCAWKQMPNPGGVLTGIDSCLMIENCHLRGNPKEMKATVDAKKLAGPLLGFINKGNYYRVQLTFRDDKNPTVCMHIQGIIKNA